ncbi:MAG: tRNA (adenosine(37)-N6)-threonylcarbamoyltransferase complex ATPase subunit type 1 TsaE [Candidatus Omnitrophica bacterium]|jgi:tRNA threonylcarbamoyladenosine biosynthesis protein TsaE|nr:tRNA (adenosine(37)-N6)-threonylcarbamoyltransferase complex ATPase subunit type 1 TsaE [Candidatus Omnitrophota bacterium]
MLELTSNSAIETVNLGKILAKVLKEKDVVLLEGALGGGKTTFAKGVLKGLGYRHRVLSPSFTLIRQYKLRSLLVYHIDLYRLESKDIFELGLDDFLSAAKTMTLIEWGNKIARELNKYLRVEFAFKSRESRRIRIFAKGYSQEDFNMVKKAYK